MSHNITTKLKRGDFILKYSAVDFSETPYEPTYIDYCLLFANVRGRIH